jgi:endo-1,4-beta-xylanase
MIRSFRRWGFIWTVGTVLLFTVHSNAELTAEFIAETDAAIEKLRKRDCSITLSVNGVPLTGKDISIVQAKNDFGFGACITRLGFTKDSVNYGNAFKKYFDWATPENEMKWTTTEEMDDYQDWSSGDYIVDWCNSNGIKVRGHNLFWNEHDGWIPGWTKTLDAPQFKAAMKRRITSAMTHYKGRVAHWDIINEIIHARGGTTPLVTMLDSLSGDPAIFSWILKEARAIDSVAKFTINEYNVVEYWSSASIFANKINGLLADGAPLDIVGLEGHFGDSLIRSRYTERLDTITTALPRPIWLTEVDFSVPVEVRADKTEELLRTSFAHPNVGGVIFWVWWEGRKWRAQLTSTLVDSNFVENDLGTRWSALRDKWKTTKDGVTDNAGTFTFRGFQGEYVAWYKEGEKLYAAPFYLEPGTGAKELDVNLKDTVLSVKQARSAPGHFCVVAFGQMIPLDKRAAGKPLTVSVYSLSGRQISSQVFPAGVRQLELGKSSRGCNVIRICTPDAVVFTGRSLVSR